MLIGDIHLLQTRELDNPQTILKETLLTTCATETQHKHLLKDKLNKVTYYYLSILQSLKELSTPLKQLQRALHKHEIIICGVKLKKLVILVTHSKTIQFICEYPSDVKLWGHCVVKLVDNNNNKNSNEITLLSFGGYRKHTLMMKYVSVWNNDNDNTNDSKMNKLNNYNKWVPFTDNYNNPIIIRNGYDNYERVHALIGRSNNHLLFITYYQLSISVFNLNIFQFIKHDTLPTNGWIQYHCFDYQLNMMKITTLFNFINYIFVMILYYLEIMHIYVNDVILFFGESSYKNGEYVFSKLVHKYLIQEKKLMIKHK
ncbi:hypothetical protein RFI_03581 [Reticulomyxa filosa]|uniref:Uncharacterized protein n=1 Tax=Reticulomyxa filosa TaxID=46433 RepID=X6P605_RETFI|nr:hypothetical protein RFI_03581 [Reticulomyxa filosa]|eukprot:ETO33519.1 hypothetical protein RFI_03581 [Reticulomyxa filosa]